MKPAYSSNYSLFIILALTALTGAVGCSATPTPSALTEVRSSYRQAQVDPSLTGNASVALREAGQSLSRAEREWERTHEEEVQHLAYVTQKRIEIARAIAERDKAQKNIEQLSEERQQIILDAREREIVRTRKDADARAQEAKEAQRAATTAQMQAKKAADEALARAQEAEQARISAQKAQEEALARSREAEQARKSAANIQARAEAARRQAEANALKTKELEEQLKALQAKVKETERGLVLTLGDVLFEFDKADLKAGALRSLYALVSFLKENPSRSVAIEGYTDNVGSESYNRDLSQRRAEAVRGFLTENGVAADRVTAEGLGETYPVASNNTPQGRQMNRRVEIVIASQTQVPEAGK